MNNYYYYALCYHYGDDDGKRPEDLRGNFAEPVRVPTCNLKYPFCDFKYITVLQPCKSGKEAVELVNQWNNDFAANGTLPKFYRRYDGTAIQYQSIVRLLD